MIRRLLYLNGLAVFCVLLYHASGFGFTAMFWWTHRYLPVEVPNFDQFGGFSYYANRVIEQLVIFGIPAFLFVSGFFIAFATKRDERTVGWNVVGNRIKNLLIPYAIWSLLIIASDYFQGTSYSVNEVLRKFIFGGAAPPYYYVILVCQLYVISPFIVPLAKNRWILLLTTTLILHVIVVGLRYAEILGIETIIPDQIMWMTQSWFFLTGIFWFSFGIVTGFHLQQLKALIGRIKWGLLAMVVITFLLGVFEWEALLKWSGQEWIGPKETIIDNLYAGAFLLSFLAFDKVSLPLPKTVGDIGSKSFGIYLIHYPVQSFTAKLIYHVTPFMLAYQLLFQLILIVFSLGIPLLLMAGVRRSPVRRFYPYLFG